MRQGRDNRICADRKRQRKCANSGNGLIARRRKRKVPHERQTKTPALLNLDTFLVKAPAAVEAAPSTAPAIEAASESSKAANSLAPESFRTSVYFSRAVHDKLREIAFEERKSITDLINEGLDHVLTARHYATTAELRGKKS